MRFYIQTFGCTANTGDSMRIAASLRRASGVWVNQWEDADTVVVNTCTVTARTELNVLKFIRKMRENGKRLIIAGCMVATQPDLIEQNDDILEMLTPSSIDGLPPPEIRGGVIGVLNIAQGCTGACTYCIVKYARGELVSAKLDKITSTIAHFSRTGLREIRITSQDCSAYGSDTCDLNLADLLNAISSIDGDFMVRVGMMNPNTLLPILDDLIDAFRSDKIFRFVHVPVQSGSDPVLAAMGRGYTVAEFERIVDAFRSAFSDMTLSTDFIAGFPGEDEADFERSVELLRAVHPEKVNITRFSPRPSTPACKMDDLPVQIKKDRSRRLNNVCREILNRQERLVGRVFDVIATERGAKGGIITRDDAYRYIVLRGGIEPGMSARVKVTESREVYLVGELL